MKLEPHGVGGERPARQPCPLDRAFTFFDSLLARPALVVERHDPLGRARRVNQLSAISSRARGPQRIRPELWVEPPPISFCQILFDRIGWAGGAGSAAVAAAAFANT